MTNLCDHYCKHGGICALDKDHTELHNASGCCQWSSEESVSKIVADAEFLLRGGPIASFLLALQETPKESLDND